MCSDPMFLHAVSEDSDQTVRLPRFAGRTGHVVGFVMQRLILSIRNRYCQEKKALEVLKNVDKKLREIKAPSGEEHNPAMSCHDVKANHPDIVKNKKSKKV